MPDLKGRIIVYSIIGCPHCMKAKHTLQQLGLAYSDVSLDNYPDSVRQDVRTRSSSTTVPQIFFNAHHIGGNAELQELVKDKDKLDSLIEELVTTEAPDDAPQPPDPSLMKDAEIGNLDFTCELDEYALLIRELKASGLIKDRGFIGNRKKRAFVGQEFIEWLIKTKLVNRVRAKEMGQAMLERRFCHALKSNDTTFHDDNTYYRLVEDDDRKALNAGVASECDPRPAAELSEYMRRLILSIYSEFLSADGKGVDYKGIGKSQKFSLYKKTTAELVRLDMEHLSREDTVAFFINIYNALVIHANVEVGPPTNLWQRYKFFNNISYVIGGQVYCLQDIENGVLRSNRRGIGMLSKPFGTKDPRINVALKECEPLVHFALVCGAKSCPPIKTYSAKAIDNQLKLAAKAFLESEDGCQIILSSKQVKLSQIFKWYKADFAKNTDELVEFVYNHMADGEKKSQLSELIAAKNYRVSFLQYDWGVNSQ